MPILKKRCEQRSKWFFAVICLAVFVKILSHALVTEDSYNTFRIIDIFLVSAGLLLVCGMAPV